MKKKEGEKEKEEEEGQAEEAVMRKNIQGTRSAMGNWRPWRQIMQNPKSPCNP